MDARRLVLHRLRARAIQAKIVAMVVRQEARRYTRCMIRAGGRLTYLGAYFASQHARATELLVSPSDVAARTVTVYDYGRAGMAGIVGP